MNRVLTMLFLGCVTSVCGAQDTKTPVPIFNLGDRFELHGKLGVKLGETITVEGTVVEGPFKGYEGGPNLVVKRVNGTTTQHLIQIPISPYFGKFGEAVFNGKPLPKCENGSTCRLRVYETGAFVGVPTDAYREAGIALQTTRFYFRSSLQVISGEKISPIEWDPIDFVDRDALLSGVARNEDGVPIIESSVWKLILSDADKWNGAQIGKHAEVFGMIRATKLKNTYRVEKCRARLISLADQLNKMVALRGTARSRDGHWWFNYRGTDLYVDSMEELPNWTADNHRRPMEIAGRLEQAELPRIDQITQKPDPELAKNYVVRRPKWTPVEELLIPELPTDE
jgi:hypothetical protein